MTLDDAGEVRWGPIVATLHLDRTWTVPGHEWLAPILALAFSDDYGGPSEGPFGHLALARLAEVVGGVVELVPRDPGPPDADYRSPAPDAPASGGDGP